MPSADLLLKFDSEGLSSYQMLLVLPSGIFWRYIKLIFLASETYQHIKSGKHPFMTMMI